MRALSICVAMATVLFLAGCCCNPCCDTGGSTAQASSGGGARTAKAAGGEKKDHALIMVEGIKVSNKGGTEQTAIVKMHTPVKEWVDRSLFFPADGKKGNYVKVIIRGMTGGEEVVDMPINSQAEWVEFRDKLCSETGLTIERTCDLGCNWDSIDIEYNFLFHSGVDNLHGKSEHKLAEPKEKKPESSK